MNEADTCRTFVLPKLVAAGWDSLPHSLAEQRSFTAGRIIPAAGKVKRGRQKRADYLLRYTRDFPIAVVEAKADYKNPSDGLQQAKDYAEVLGLKFAYGTNGTGIVEFDYLTGKETSLDSFPTPADLWARLRAADPLDQKQADHLLTPFNLQAGKIPRYYQEIAVNRTVQAIISGKPRVLLTMATGTGKTTTAFQICWKLWNSRWNKAGATRRPRILYLADRNILINDPLIKDFAPFGDAAYKITDGKVVLSREIYFAIYQAIARDERRPGLYREFPPDFFDLVIVDECHRGSARESSTWREILDYFKPASQLGMTATPLRDESRDTYDYFGRPIYSYSLRQGIEDGFLAPYRVHRVVTTADAAGWRPTKDELDRYGRPIPDDEYQTKDFERVVALRARTEAIARHLTDHLKATDRFAKTLVFCVDQEHADEMRRILSNLNADLVQKHPNYVCRVTADEGDVGKGHLSKFQDLETITPVILTTSQLLTTGVDAPTVKNIALIRVVGSMSEFKQIIGRGTRVRDDYGKLFFTILDYTGSASRHFADPDFDGDPVFEKEETIDDEGKPGETTVIHPEPPLPPTPDPNTTNEPPGPPDVFPPPIDEPPIPPEPTKFYVDTGSVGIATEVISDLDAEGKKLQVVALVDRTRDRVRALFRGVEDLRRQWAMFDQRRTIRERLADQGIDFEELARTMGLPDADPFDLLCHAAFNAPLRTRRERADRLRKAKKDIFDRFGPEARAILEELLEKYAAHGADQFKLPDTLKMEPIKLHGTTDEIIALFGGVENLREAVDMLQRELYAA